MLKPADRAGDSPQSNVVVLQPPPGRQRAARGVVVGILIAAAMWAIIAYVVFRIRGL